MRSGFSLGPMLATDSHIGDKEHRQIGVCVCGKEEVMGKHPFWMFEMEMLLKVTGHEQRVYKK